MNRHARINRRKENTMTNAEATTTETAATVAEQGAPVAPTKAASKKGASPQKDAPKAKKTARAAKPAAKKSAKSTKKAAENAPRAESKGAKILELIARPKGATLAEIMKATEWQAHSVRGFLSSAGKKRGIEIESSKNDAGERVYQIKKWLCPIGERTRPLPEGGGFLAVGFISARPVCSPGPFLRGADNSPATERQKAFAILIDFHSIVMTTLPL
jgi:hypothetical protein